MAVTHVAVKVLRPGAADSDRADFLGEIEVMLPLAHERVVRMLGVCTLQEPALIIEEFMANGNLQTFLTKVMPLLVHT